MKRRLRYRQKILLSQIALFLALVLFTLPFVEKGLTSVQRHALTRGAIFLTNELSTLKDPEEMAQYVSQMHGDLFYKVSLYDDKAELIVTSNVGIMGDERSFFLSSVPIVKSALESGRANDKTITTDAGEVFISVAAPFTFQQKHYVLIGAYPFAPVQLFNTSFNYWFGFVCIGAVAIFSFFTFMMFKRLHRPIGKMVVAISAYSRGEKDAIPKMLKGTGWEDDEDLGRLSATLVSLYDRVEGQLIELKQARDEREAILESLCEGVIAVDISMHIDYINFIGAKMLGLSKRSAIGKELDEHLLKAKEEVLLVKCKELLIHVLAHKTMVTDSIAIENTAKIYYDLIAAPRAGRGAILVIQDRSSQRKVLEMGKDFIANASHELRTPITIIKGFAETLEDMKEMPHDMLSSIVEKIVRNCERMENLVSNLLTLADMENLSISPYVSCDVIALIQGCMDIVSSVYPDAMIHLHTTREPIYAAADASIMELALINLLTNAAKYSQGPATIDVKVEAASEDVIISISDHGIGIPAADLEHIFERFYTVNKAHSRKLGGAGLGLSLVKTIIEKHHGSIEVSSTLGRGTTFTIHLPLPRGG